MRFLPIKLLSCWFHWLAPPRAWRKSCWGALTRPNKGGSPAQGVRAAGAPQLQTAGFVPLLVWAGRDNGATATLSTRLVRARAEQQGVAQLPWHPLEKLSQGLKHTAQRKRSTKRGMWYRWLSAVKKLKALNYYFLIWEKKPALTV